MPRKVSAKQLHQGLQHHLPGEALGEAPSATELEGASDGKLSDRFEWPPFSILNTTAKAWRDRKKAYLSLGIQSELGRGEGTNPGSKNDRRHGREDSEYQGGNAYMANSRGPGPLYGHKTGQTYRSDNLQSSINGRKQSPETASLKGGLTWGTTMHPYDNYGKKKNARAANAIPGGSKLPGTKLGDDGHTVRQEGSGTSVFDPVLCELMYRWFCPPNGVVLDPFAGGSVRGIVAALWGRRYVGIDLRLEQVMANIEQKAIAPAGSQVAWLHGDSRKMDEYFRPKVKFDFIFTCPPYFNLELYSYDPADLSNAESYDMFSGAYGEIIDKAAARLRDNRFAAFVVGNFRDKQGITTDFVGDTIALCAAAGLRYYNEAILATAVGSLALRTRMQFRSTRKMGKMHQQVLIFVKGDAKKAAAATRGE